MNLEKVAVVNITSFGREFPEHLQELEERVGPVDKMLLPADMDGEALASRLKGYTYVLLGNYPSFDEAFFSRNQDVKLIARHGIGFNNVDLESSRRHGVYVTHIQNYVELDAVAEQAAALLMAVSKHVVIADRKVHEGNWNKDRQELMGFQLRGCTTGVIGCGHIGTRFAMIMKYGFHNRILAYDPYADKDKVMAEGIQLCDLDTLLRESDFISLHANLTENSRHLINAEALAKMKNRAILINTGRGPLVDEAAVLDALKSGRLSGYGADVAAHEPMEKDDPLLTCEQAVITPHSAIYNYTCMKNMNRKVMEDIYCMQRGERPVEIINGL
ncbi:3-phosphoglycerate dehydrogenase [[Clostridium] innocuum]|nr:3-phosphoglycerate dehydrogenase [[Clostridium] innocuum]